MSGTRITPPPESGDRLPMPGMICPRCGAEHDDFDGFGFIAHTKPAYADGCGWCSHPTRDGDGEGAWICTICGDKRIGDG